MNYDWNLIGHLGGLTVSIWANARARQASRNRTGFISVGINTKRYYIKVVRGDLISTRYYSLNHRVAPFVLVGSGHSCSPLC